MECSRSMECHAADLVSQISNSNSPLEPPVQYRLPHKLPTYFLRPRDRNSEGRVPRRPGYTTRMYCDRRSRPYRTTNSQGLPLLMAHGYVLSDIIFEASYTAGHGMSWM